MDPRNAMMRAEERKDQLYRNRMENVDGGNFIPLIPTTRGARSYKTAKTISKLGSMIANKKKEHVSDTVRKLSQELSLCLLRAELSCVRGTRKEKRNNI